MEPDNLMRYAPFISGAVRPTIVVMACCIGAGGVTAPFAAIAEPVGQAANTAGPVEHREAPGAIGDTPMSAPKGESLDGDAAPDLPAADAPKVYGPSLAPDVRVSRTMPVPDWSDSPAFIPRALVESINISTRYNAAVISAWDAVRASHADLSSVRWQRFPSVTTAFNRYSAGAYASYPSVLIDLPLVTFGRIGSQIKRAKSAQLQAVATWRQKVLDIAVQTEQAYFQVIAAARKQRILEEGVKEHFRLVESMSRRVAMNVSPHADLLLAQSRLEQIQSDLEAASAQRSTALHNLAELLQGHPQALGAVPQYDPRALEIDWANATDQAVEYNPSREEALAQADGARDAVSAAKASVFPQVDAQYSYDPIYGSRVGLALKLQASGGFSEFSQITAAQDRFQAALAQVRDIERQLRQTIEDQLVSNHSARVQAAISADVAATTRDVSESYERQFIAGHRSWLDVMNSVREDINSRLTKATVEVNAMDTATQLEMGTGRWQPALAEEAQK